MPFNVGESINYVSEKFTSSPLVKNIMKNPFYTALLIVAIIVLIILFVFRNVDFSGEEESLGKLVFRGSIYMILVVTAIQFLNNQIWIQDTKNKSSSAEVKAVFGGVENLPIGGVKPVIATTIMKGAKEGYVPKGAGVITVNVSGLSTTGNASVTGSTAPEMVPTGDITN